MSKTRNNHYVPQWYQDGFFELGRNTLAYLDLSPPCKILDDGRVVTAKSRFDAPTSRAFRQTDLYSTFFGTTVNDEVERRLFGDIDARGAKAVRAFAGTDVSEWHEEFQTFFEYIDIQKIRTPKGLDWLKAQYPTLTQNELMLEMQGIRTMHCTIWTEGVREIVSAEEADIKFIVTDHPVTIYNYAVPPEARLCTYPSDPTIALKGSQTIFPLNRHFCLILTNLEYAQDPSTDPLGKRTFPRNYRNSMVRTDAFIRMRKLAAAEVARINYILKKRACRYIAAGCKEWLYPENTVTDDWAKLRKVLLPPKGELYQFGGELYVQFKDGHVHYQDEFGRTEKRLDFLKKDPPVQPLRPKDWCGCGSGRRFGECCNPKPIELRPTWSEPSIRERNLMFGNAIVNVLGLEKKGDWVKVRKDLTDEKISKVYLLYQALWPIETDLLQLLPRPDGIARAVYAGLIHPTTITEFAAGASLYFGELLIEHPFMHAGNVKKEFSPVENPRAYRQEFLKAVVFFLNLMPMIECGFVNLIPDPCNFDIHLRYQMLQMAKFRSMGTGSNPTRDERGRKLMEQDCRRTMLLLPRDTLRYQLAKFSPELDPIEIDAVMQHIEQLKEHDPLAVLQENSIGGTEKGGQFNVAKLLPNFEMAMYLAQATGSCIVTDNLFRWNEIEKAIQWRPSSSDTYLSALINSIESSVFAFPQEVPDIIALAAKKNFAAYPALMSKVFKYHRRLADHGPKPNVEAQLNAHFLRGHSSAQAVMHKACISSKKARIHCRFPTLGIQDNTVNRLLLMSSSEMHLPGVPMAFYIEGQES